MGHNLNRPDLLGLILVFKKDRALGLVWFRMTITRFGVTVGRLRVSIGWFGVTIGWFRVTIGWFRVTIGRLRMTVGRFRMAIGRFRRVCPMWSWVIWTCGRIMRIEWCHRQETMSTNLLVARSGFGTELIRKRDLQESGQRLFQAKAYPSARRSSGGSSRGPGHWHRSC